MTNWLFLVRGLPGSGKTTLSRKLAEREDRPSWPVLAADDFFEKDGEYKFDASKIKLAHENCKDRCEEAMKTGTEKIFVSNTFTQEWEMESYWDLAKKYGYTVANIVVENRHGNISIHGVPDEAMERMKNRFEVKL